MSMVVWKHQFPQFAAGGVFKLRHGAKVLHFAEQHEQLCIWEAHDEAETRIERRAFQVLCTGHPADIDFGRYVGTCLVHGGDYVFHLFEVDP